MKQFKGPSTSIPFSESPVWSTRWPIVAQMAIAQLAKGARAVWLAKLAVSRPWQGLLWPLFEASGALCAKVEATISDC